MSTSSVSHRDDLDDSGSPTAKLYEGVAMLFAGLIFFNLLLFMAYGYLASSPAEGVVYPTLWHLALYLLGTTFFFIPCVIAETLIWVPLAAILCCRPAIPDKPVSVRQLVGQVIVCALSTVATITLFQYMWSWFGLAMPLLFIVFIGLTRLYAISRPSAPPVLIAVKLSCAVTCLAIACWIWMKYPETPLL